MSEVITELFVHRPTKDRVELVSVSETMTVSDAVRVQDGEHVWIEDVADELQLTLTLAEAGVRHRGHVHVNRCRRVKGTVTYNGVTKDREFEPGAPLRRVRTWALDHAFTITAQDAADLVLVLAGTTTAPDLSDHIGSFVDEHCTAAFALVPKPRPAG